MNRKRIISIIAIILAFLMAFSLLASVLPAYAITQNDINALKAKRDALAEESAAAQERVDLLKEEQANVLILSLAKRESLLTLSKSGR